jgi:adenine deaminase
MIISGKLVDIHRREIYPAEISVSGSFISKIIRVDHCEDRFVIPGLTDSHIHIESSMVTPGSFAEAAVSRGTTAVVSDPHEIANVLGIEGIRFMIEDSKKVPLRFFFGASSCVPATPFESAGSVLNADAVRELLSMHDIHYLAEMMNYPGVVYGDGEVMKKLEAARKLNKPVDGHVPGLTGDPLRKYIAAGISTDHECTSAEEAREKIRLGMKILIREGSAAKNLDALKQLFTGNPEMLMLCSDDLHPEMLLKQHINALVARLVSEGYDIFDVIRSCTINPAEHYNLSTGLLRPGDPADLIVVDNPAAINLEEPWIDGKKVFEHGRILFKSQGVTHLNNFTCNPIRSAQIEVEAKGRKIRIIEAYDGNLNTGEIISQIPEGKEVKADIESDILKIVVKDRYEDRPPAVGFIKGFGLKRGAFASSVAHDSHNIICIGTDDNDIVNAINKVVEMKGGLAVADGRFITSLSLPVAGIMSDEPVIRVAQEYERLSDLVKSMECKMTAPFMTLSFMALLVIPELKLSDKGLFDGREFRFTNLFAD